jgi:hypothetical protein
MQAFYRNSVKDFLIDDTNRILGALADGMARLGFETNQETIESWKLEISQLSETLGGISKSKPEAKNWGILLEYTIPMIGQRLDCVIVAGDVVLVVEFKGGDSTSGQSALRQAQEYALNLADFHEQSRGKVIIPIALGDFKSTSELDPSNPAKGAICKLTQLEDTLKLAEQTWGGKQTAINLKEWENSRYFPVPTIIEAASKIYSNHNVKELAQSKAGIENLRETEDCIVNAVKDAKANGTKKLIILTGVPGAGKTLAGLNAVQAIQSLLDTNKEQASFLSGNAPLVKVLQEALKRDVKKTGKKVARSIKSRIRDMHVFVKESFPSTLPPADRLVVFDEAQRAWTAARNFKKFKRDFSEPNMSLDIMARHDGWAVIIALVGGGQEIHGGEAGLSAWGDAIKAHPEWEVVTSPEALHGGPSVAGSRLFRTVVPSDLKITELKDLHLSVSRRTFESENTAAWVNAALNGDIKEAYSLSRKGLPIYLTRDLNAARSWLKQASLGKRRVGLIASSGADRLRAEGVETPTYTFLQGVQYERWFLDETDDHRSSNQLEVALSEFEMQGLEIDLSCLLWGGDLIYQNGKLTPRQLKQTTWVNTKGKSDPQAGADDNTIKTINKYRVLLTRFRKAMVIYVPHGDKSDKTRLPEDFDSIFNYLKECGLLELP